MSALIIMTIPFGVGPIGVLLSLAQPRQVWINWDSIPILFSGRRTRLTVQYWSLPAGFEPQISAPGSTVVPHYKVLIEFNSRIITYPGGDSHGLAAAPKPVPRRGSGFLVESAPELRFFKPARLSGSFHAYSRSLCDT
ncbi:hypothetical protein BC826DRAFT_185239 [Russula brevipes]|nr:hypothetical protein BC826DRAFT_185239 [Russula brevipes]